jgi:hypothetical protein
VGRGDETLRLEPDSLAAGPNGLWYLLVRHRLGKVKPGMLLTAYRRPAGDSEWELMGAVPGSDDLSTFDAVGFDVSPAGRLAVAFATYEGELRVAESSDGGRTWTSLGAPGRLRVPGLRSLVPGFRPTIRDGMPSVRWARDGWGLAWEEHVSRPTGLSTHETWVDTLFSSHDAAAGWTATTRVNDRRIVVAETFNVLGQVGKSSMQALEELHRKGRGTELRHPHLSRAPTGSLAVLWTELRDEKIVPVASLSDDGGRTWSAAVPLDSSPDGDADRVRGSFSADGKILQAIYLAWPGRSVLVSKKPLGVEVAEISLE